MGSMIRMPQLGLTMTEGTVVTWLKRPGDEVKAGEAVAQIETDKLTSEVESETAGILLELYAAEGDVVPVQGPLAFIGTAGETLPGRGGVEGTQAIPGGEASRVEGPANEAGVSEPAVRLVARSTSPAAAVAEAAVAGGGRIVASPLAKKTARALGVSLTGLRGSGPGGRIVQKDVVERSRFAAGSPPSVKPAGSSLPASPASGTAAAESAASSGSRS